jgi:hypothetical protein
MGKSLKADQVGHRSEMAFGKEAIGGLWSQRATPIFSYEYG